MPLGDRQDAAHQRVVERNLGRLWRGGRHECGGGRLLPSGAVRGGQLGDPFRCSCTAPPRLVRDLHQIVEQACDPVEPSVPVGLALLAGCGSVPLGHPAVRARDGARFQSAGQIVGVGAGHAGGEGCVEPQPGVDGCVLVLADPVPGISADRIRHQLLRASRESSRVLLHQHDAVEPFRSVQTALVCLAHRGSRLFGRTGDGETGERGGTGMSGVGAPRHDPVPAFIHFHEPSILKVQVTPAPGVNIRPITAQLSTSIRPIVVRWVHD